MANARNEGENDATTLIYSYTREMAIKDGVLHDVSETAREAGFGYPVAITDGVYARCVAVPANFDYQSEAGRLWNVLSMTRVACAKAASQGADTVCVKFHTQNSRTEPPKPITLKAEVGPGDSGEPVITIMLPHED